MTLTAAQVELLTVLKFSIAGVFPGVNHPTEMRRAAIPPRARAA
jgi:hypothetical protein